MNIKKVSFVVVLLSCLLQACSNENGMKYALIPEPQSMKVNGDDLFEVDGNTQILYIGDDKESERNALFLSEWINEATSVKLKVKPSGSVSEKNSITFCRDTTLQKEGFKLNITSEGVLISSADGAGAFYATQLLRKTMLQQTNKLAFAMVEIHDYPAFAYRGAMLDVGRNFFTVDQVKRFIDLLALHHLNYFHWHLTEDQGWRIEIKKYPELTRMGAWSGDGAKKKGGFYTQDEIKEVVAYAAERYISVIPEIDLPGHSSAALAAYPQLGCTGGPYQVATTTGGVYHDVLCVGNEFAMQFAKDVLQEVADLFPAPYLHIGGDEVPRDRWEACSKCQAYMKRNQLKDTDSHTAEDLLQGTFNIQMSDYLKGLGKQMIGWDEVLSGKISSETVVMTWRGLNKGVSAARNGHPVIFSSNSHFYFNNYQATNTEKEPEATGGFVPMQRVYEASVPPADLNEEEQRKVLGAEVCLWSSFVYDNQSVDYMMLPRLAAFSELVWTGKERSGYQHFLERLPTLLNCYQRLGYQYAPHFFEIETTYTPNMVKRHLDIALTSISGAEIYYTLDGTEPTRSAKKYTESLQVSESGILQARAYLSNGIQSDLLTKEIEINKATFSPIEMLTISSERYEGSGGAVLVDGIRSETFHTTGLWVGNNTDDIVSVIDLKQVQLINEVKVSSLTDLSSWIMGPASIEIFLSNDGKQYTSAASESYEAADGRTDGKSMTTYCLPVGKEQTRYVKVVARRFKGLPDNHTSAGEPPYLFLDEIGIY